MGCNASTEAFEGTSYTARQLATTGDPSTLGVEEPAPDTPLSLRSSDADRDATLPQTPPGPLDAASNIAVLAASRPRESPEAEHLVSLPLPAPAAMRTFQPVEQFSSGAPSLGPLRVSAKDLQMPPPPSQMRAAPASSVAALGRPPGGGPKRRFLAGSSAFGTQSCSTAATMSGDSLLDSNVVQNPLLTPPPFSRP